MVKKVPGAKSPVKRSQQIAAALSRLVLVFRSESWKRSMPESLSPTQARALRHLMKGAPVALGELAKELGVTAPTASEAVSALVQRGLVQRMGAVGDRRKLALGVTPEGRSVARRLVEPEELFEAAIARLPPFEQALLARGLAYLIEELQEAGAISVARICTSCRHFRWNAHSDPEFPHHCAFLDRALASEQLRLDCPDHLLEKDASLRAERRLAWVAPS